MEPHFACRVYVFHAFLTLNNCYFCVLHSPVGFRSEGPVFAMMLELNYCMVIFYMEHVLKMVDANFYVLLPCFLI